MCGVRRGCCCCCCFGTYREEIKLPLFEKGGLENNYISGLKRRRWKVINEAARVCLERERKLVRFGMGWKGVYNHV